MDTIFNIANSLLSTPLGLIHLLILTDGWKYSKKKTGSIISVYLVLMLAMDAAVLAVGGDLADMKRRISLINIVSCAIVYVSITKYRDGRLLFSFFSACICIFIGDTVSDIVFFSAAVHLAVKILTFLAIALLLYRFFRLPFQDVMRTIKKEWWWLMTVPLSLCMVFAMIIMVPGPLFLHPEMQPQAIFMCFACVFVYVAFYMVFKSMQKQQQVEENNQLLKLQIRLLEKHTQTLLEMSEHIRIYRHDTRHYVRMLTACMEQEDWGSASAILKQIDSQASVPVGNGEILALTGAVALDAVLSFYTDLAEKEGASLRTQMAAPPKEKAEITDFSALVSNALENAIHACVAMEPGAPREIRITGRMMQDRYLLEISNTYEGSVDFDRAHRPVSKTELHGYGTRSMVDFAERNRGQLEFKAEDGWFYVRIIL